MVTLLLLLLVAAGLLLLQWQRRRQIGARRPPPPLARTLFDLQPGDIVQAEAGDWVVEERLLYDQQGFTWLEYLLRDGALRRWLVVCEDDELELSWLEEIDLGELDVQGAELLAAVHQSGGTWSFPPSCAWRGVSHRRCEQGEARVSGAAGRCHRRPGACRFADYQAAGGGLLCLEAWGEPPESLELEASVGHRLDPLSLSLLPGDGRSVYRPQ
jgi:Domain of unknown function (DUF4178)